MGLVRSLSFGSDLGPHGDAWNGAKFAEKHINNLLYVEATGQWLQWSGIRWKSITKSEAAGFARSCAQRLYRERKNAFVENGADDARLLASAKSVSERWDRILKILEAAKSFPGMAVHGPGEFDLNPMFFGVENGMLDLRSGDLLDPSPDQMISKIGRVFFDKSATAPQFQQFLQQVMPDAEMCGFLQRAVGYTMTGSVDEEVIFFMYGVGANGKSVFGNIIHALLGEYSVSLGAALITKNKHENEAERLKARLPGSTSCPDK